MTNVQLYMAPGTCARVAAICLAEIGLDVEPVPVRFMAGEHKSPGFRKLNPAGKVPALVIDNEVLTENVAIVTYLNTRFPEAHLMPDAPDALARARQIADLCFCAATLHPLVTRIRMPQLFVDEHAVQSVWEKACVAMTEFFGLTENRLAAQPWWYGDRWSAMDAYLYWVYWRVAGAGFDVRPYPVYSAHAEQMQTRPAVERALQYEQAVEAVLESEGLSFTPPPRG